jgi:hypothetical protein
LRQLHGKASRIWWTGSALSTIYKGIAGAKGELIDVFVTHVVITPFTPFLLYRNGPGG